MKLEEIDRAHLEIIFLKLKSIEDRAVALSQETERLQNENNKIIKDFCEANQLDITKTSVDVSTGEVTTLEKEV